jgi:hypothetical protein
MTPSRSPCSRDSRACGLLGLLLLGGLTLFCGCDGRFVFDPVASAGAAGRADADSGVSALGGSVSAEIAGAPAAGMPAAGAASAGAPGSGSAGSAGGPVAFGTCLSDPDCGLPSLHCDVSSMRCVECVRDNQCPAARPACLSASGTCAACSITVDCGPGEQCDPQTNKCLKLCTSNADCHDPNASCNSAGTCQVCDDEDDCSVALGGLHCQRSAGACVQCFDDTQCRGATPHCAPASGQCVACLDSADCARAAPFCDPVVHVCSAATDG